MEEELFLAFYNETSKRHAVIEDDGLTAWLYLSQPSDDPAKTKPIDSYGFVYNRKEPIEVKEVQNYRPDPPPIAKGYASEEAVCTNPDQHRWSVLWSEDGESVLLQRDGIPWCLIMNGEKMGYSKAIKVEGDWGHPWNDEKLKEMNRLAKRKMDKVFLTDSELATSIKQHLKSTYPNIQVTVEKWEKDPSQIAIYFIEEKFKKLYPQQRYHYLIHNIPDSFLQEYLSESVWFELAPDEKPETLRYPDEERINKITPAIMKILTRVNFFSALDDIMAPQDKEKKGASCHGDFDLSKKILKTHGFTEEEMFDIFHVLMGKGGFCDCEILYNASEGSRLKTRYWDKIVKKKIKNK